MIHQWQCITTSGFNHSLLPNHNILLRELLFNTPHENMKNILRFYQFWKTDNIIEPIHITAYYNSLKFDSGLERWIGTSLRNSPKEIEFDLFCLGNPPPLDNVKIVKRIAKHKGKNSQWKSISLITDYRNKINTRAEEGKRIWEQDWPHTKIIFTWDKQTAEWFPEVEHYTTKYKMMNKLKRTIHLDVNDYGGPVETMKYLFNNRLELIKD
tara:strand:- start:268 stop:900 length:633 start_codon:yes stop_codon:yes gene_type:complete